MRKLLSIIIIVLTLMSCGSKTPQDLFDEDKSGVVMILNQFYYVLTLPNGNKIYFSGIDNNGTLQNITFNKAEIINKRAAMTGTGFFIDKQGTIMTNRHVAQPQIDKKAIKEGYNKLVASIKAYYISQMQWMSGQYDVLEAQKSYCVSYDYYGNAVTDESKLQAIEEKQQELNSQYQMLQNVVQSLDGYASANSLDISTVCQVGIAYNDTYVQSANDFFGKNACTVVKVSQQEDTDLALLQLKSKTTPDNAYIFKTDGTADMSWADKLKEMFSPYSEKLLEINQDLYMIGYNAGPTLASTKQGIQVQMTTGKVTQLPDGDRVLYSIPTVQGSSGSPVVDSKGRLVAVNFAKLIGSDNFNFGIPMNKVKAFLEK